MSYLSTIIYNSLWPQQTLLKVATRNINIAYSWLSSSSSSSLCPLYYTMAISQPRMKLLFLFGHFNRLRFFLCTITHEENSWYHRCTCILCLHHTSKIRRVGLCKRKKIRHVGINNIAFCKLYKIIHNVTISLVSIRQYIMQHLRMPRLEKYNAALSFCSVLVNTYKSFRTKARRQ